MYWANFLHIYQPPTQKEIWVRRITEESYRKVILGLLDIPRARLTININGILCELLARWGGKDVIKGIKTLLERGQLELTGSAKYHAFLPLLPEEEIERQILLNETILDYYFGGLWKNADGSKRGFFAPEMAYDKKVARVAQRLGYRWIIIDELALPTGKKLDHTTVHTIKDIDSFVVFFRERSLSFAILSSRGAGAAPTILRYLGERLQSPGYALTAMDGETFGHHRPGLETLFFDILKSEEVQPLMVSDLLEKFPARDVLEPRDSTWAASKKDMRDGTPFARWYNKENPIQVRQWELTNLAIAIVHRAPHDTKTRELLDQALHSDQYWWASARPWWSLEMIERGAFELKTIIFDSSASNPQEKEKAETWYREILSIGFEWQRTGKVDEISRKEDEEVAERLEEKEKLFITKAEYHQMIKVLEEQMHLAATTEEYHRAAMIKDRIRELNEEMGKAKE